MTPDEAILRAKQKLRTGKSIDEHDIANLTVSTYQEGYKEGIESAYREMANLCAKYVPKEKP